MICLGTQLRDLVQFCIQRTHFKDKSEAKGHLIKWFFSGLATNCDISSVYKSEGMLKSAFEISSLLPEILDCILLYIYIYIFYADLDA